MLKNAADATAHDPVTRLQLCVTGVCELYKDALSHLLNEVDEPLLGRPVQVHRLQSAGWQHLNGALGMVRAFDAESGRYHVQLARSPLLKGRSGPSMDVVALTRETLLRLAAPPPGVLPREPAPRGATTLDEMAAAIGERVAQSHRDIDTLVGELERSQRGEAAQLERLQELHEQHEAMAQQLAAETEATETLRAQSRASLDELLAGMQSLKRRRRTPEG